MEKSEPAIDFTLGKDALATAEDLEDYDERKRELEEEMERRKRVGIDVGKVSYTLLAIT